MNSEYGSQWRKWDFHVHTPFSVLNNQFGLDAEKPEEFDEYVRQLFMRAIEKDIWAIGITDYFSIDGYGRLKNDYLDCPEKLEELFPEPEARERISKILVFPNIEMRLNCFVEDKPIGYHVLFSDKVDAEDIEDKFLYKLSFSSYPGESLPLTRGNIVDLGKMLKKDNGERGDDYEVGLRHVTVDMDDVLKTLDEFSGFKDRYIISAPVDESACNIDWKGRDYLTRKNIYASCHCYMTSNPRTREWALGEESGKDHKKQRVAEFGSLKPCIWGSDAHSFDRMLEPDKRRYCWVKADPTFDGLLQILCEPKDRIVIQEERPEHRDPHRSIESIQFDDDHFPSTPVPFSEGLTCIIGGRSTGKSLLLRQLARAIDPEQVSEREKRSSLFPLELPATAKVIWRDGTSDPRKIIYLPQTFLNRTVDDPESSEGASGLIRDVLLQNEAMKAASEMFAKTCEQIERKLHADIDDYLATRASLEQSERKLMETGASALFKETEKRLQEEYKELLGQENASLEEVKTYEGLGKRREELEGACGVIDEDVRILRGLPVPQVSEPLYNGTPCLDALSDAASEALGNEIADINEALAKRWDTAVAKVTKEREDARADLLAKKGEIEEQIAELKPKMEHTGKLTQAMSRLNGERWSLMAATKLEDEISRLKERLAVEREAIIFSREAFLKASGDYCAKVTELTGEFESSLEFSAMSVWRLGDFTRSVSSLLDARKFSGFRRATGYDLGDLKDEDYGDDLLDKMWRAVLGELNEGNLQLKGGLGEEDFLRKIFDNWYNVHYVVTSDGDRLDRMSPGKKGLVLLELIIELEQGDCPILIDQPEDDLDNQSVYSELRKFIKDSKKRRQIIIVTHNANIALGADAEEIIVANQHGAGRENADGRQFDYRSGAIENTVRPSASKDAPFLDSRSIQEHMCQILEGGREALEERRKKYSMRVEP